MKKLLLALALLLSPIPIFGATNLFNDVWMTSSLRLTFGAPGAGKVLISDANGFGTWGTVGSAGGGDVFTQSNNTFTVSKTNTFNGVLVSSGLLVNTNSATYSTAFGSFTPGSGVLIKPIGAANDGASGRATVMLIGPVSGGSAQNINYGAYVENGRGVNYAANGIYYNLSAEPFVVKDGASDVKISLANSFTTGTNFFGGLDASATMIRGSSVIVSSNLAVNGNISWTGNATMGDGSPDTLLINASTATTPNGLNFNSGQFNMTTSGTNTMATALQIGAMSAANSIGATEIVTVNSAFNSNGAVSNNTVMAFNTPTAGPGETIGIKFNNRAWFGYGGSRGVVISDNGAAKDIIFMSSTNGTINSPFSSTERMRIVAATGFVGINTTPSYRLTVNPTIFAHPAAAVVISAIASNQVPFVVITQPGAVSNAVEVLNSSGTVHTSISASGRLITIAVTANGVPGNSSVFGPGVGTQGNTTLVVGPGTATGNTNLVLQGTAGGTGPLLLAKNSAGTTLFKVSETGALSIGINGTPIISSLSTNYVIDPPSIPSAASFLTNVVFTGALAGMPTMIGSTAITSNIVRRVDIASDNVATIQWSNIGILAADPPSQTVQMRVMNQ